VTGDGDRDGPGDLHPDEREDRPEIDIDAAFAAIVADFASRTPAGAGPWPAAEDVDEEARTGDWSPGGPPEPVGPDTGGPDVVGQDSVSPDTARFRPGRGPRHRLPDGTAGPGAYELGPGYGRGEDDDDLHERFVPPEPPPITSTDLTSRLAWLGVIGGPLFMLVAALVWQTLPTLVVIGALSAFIGGFLTLVARLPRDRGDGSDDGAVV
jgi:hypothetical protein